MNNVMMVSGAQHNDPSVHMCASILPQLPSYSDCHRTLSGVPCAVQSPVGHPVKIKQCIHVNPKLPVSSSHLSPQ